MEAQFTPEAASSTGVAGGGREVNVLIGIGAVLVVVGMAGMGVCEGGMTVSETGAQAPNSSAVSIVERKNRLRVR
jgi:hypothetical protein